MPNTNFQTIFQMPSIVNDIVKQATGRDSVSQIDMDFVTVGQDKQTVPHEIDYTALASFVNNNQLPLSVLAKITAVQSGEGDPAPDNVRPITGWTGVNVTRTGKNLLKIKYPGRTNADVTYSADSDGVVTLSGTATSTSYMTPNYSFETGKPYMTFIPAGTYILHSDISSSNINPYLVIYDINGNLVGQSGNETGSGLTVTFTEPRWVLPSIRVTNGTATNKVMHLQFEPGTTKTEYETYNGKVYAVTFPADPGTIYGGVLNVTAGILTVTHALKTLTENDNFSINTSETTNRITASFYNDVGKTNGSFKSDSLSPIANSTGGYASDPWNIWGSTSAARLWISVPTTIDSVDAFKEYLQENPIDILYELATPVAVQLTPTEIKSLIGENNIYADTGDVAVSYTSYIPVP